MLIDRVQCRSDEGRGLDVTVAVGTQDEYATELHLLGEATHRGQQYTFHGTTWLREGRDTPEVVLHRCDTGELVSDQVALDIVVAISIEMDGRNGSIIQREMDRICG